MNFWEKAGTVILVVALMEGFAWFAHKYIMHGWGWDWHKSHHEPRTGPWEKNDLYAVTFAGVAIGLFVVGLWIEPLWWVAVGITAYGALYGLVHDVFVHQRLPHRFVPRSGYAKRVLQAHKLHHAVNTKEGAVSFGFLIAPDPTKLKARIKVLAEQRQQTHRQDERTPA